MLKKSLAMVLMATLLFTLSSTAFATDVTLPKEETSETITMDELLERLNSIDFGREVTFTARPQAKTGNQDVLSFDSVEAAEACLRDFMSTPRSINIPTEAFGQSQPQSLTRAKDSGWYTTTVWWWGGGNTSLLSYTNAETKFYYNNSGDGSISNITISNSYMTGIVGATWTHRSGTGTALGGMDAQYSVTGTWFIGLDIFGLPVGGSFNETITSPVLTMNMYDD